MPAVSVVDVGGGVRIFARQLVPTSKFEIGFYSILPGLIALLVVGFLDWQDYSKATKEFERASFQNKPAYAYPNHSCQQRYPPNPQQNPQPYGRQDGAYPPSQDQSVFLYQQNHRQYENYQQSAQVYPNVLQSCYQAPGSNQQAPYYQPQPQQPPQPQPLGQPCPQQPTHPQQNHPDNPVRGWRAIHPTQEQRG